MYVFIDEIQYLKNPSNFLKYIFDQYKSKIKLIVSGSSSFYIDDEFKDSLAGRKIIFPINSLSFDEFLDFKDIPAIPEENFPKHRRKEYEIYLEEYMTYGGFPRIVLEKNKEMKKILLSELVNAYLKKDVFEQNIKNISNFMLF